MNVSIIYVNYNSSELIANSINSVIELTIGISYEIIVVDNNSKQEDKNKLKLYCTTKNIQLIESNTNLGFGKGNNLGTKYATGEYLFFLNPDTYLLNNAITKLFNFVKTHNISTCGANLFSADLKPTLSYWMLMPSITDELSALFSNIPLKFKYNYSHEHNLTTTPKEVAFITGADLMIHNKLFNQLNGFDEDFFMYFEETDLQYRAKKLGHKIYNLPSAKIVHLESQTLSSQSKKLQLFFESRKLFYLKNRTKTQLKIANSILKINSIIRICIFYILQKKEKVNYWKTILLQCS
jgi:GT2 family glycosyltransferase